MLKYYKQALPESKLDFSKDSQNAYNMYIDDLMDISRKCKTKNNNGETKTIENQNRNYKVKTVDNN